MDALSRLLSLHPVRTALDTRCQLAVPWRMNYAQEADGVAPYHLMVAGCTWLSVPGQEPVFLQAGDMIMLTRGQAHSLYTSEACEGAPLHAIEGEAAVARLGNDGAGPRTDILCGQFHFGSSISNSLIAALPDIVLIRAAGRQEGLQALVTLLRDETDELRPGASAVVSHLASALFSLLLRGWLEQASAVPGLFSLLAHPRLTHALHDMLAEPGRAWSPDQLAQRCNMSRATFVRLFRKIAGSTPGDLLLRVRMAQAAQWLARADRSVGEIGEAVGYQSEAAFNRAFKRQLGVGPGQYRREAGATGASPAH